MIIKNFSLADVRRFIPGFLNHTDENQDVRRENSKWNKLKLFIMPVFGLVLFFIIISRISFAEFLAVFTNFHPYYFILTIITGVFVTIIKTARYEYFFPAPGRRLELYGNFEILRVLYYILPFNSGELAYLTALKKNKFAPTISETAPTWVFMRINDIIALTFWFIVAIYFQSTAGSLYGVMYSYRWIIITISVSLIICVFLFPFVMAKFSFENKDSWLLKHFHLFKTGAMRTFGLAVFLKTLLVSVVLWAILISINVFALFTFNTPFIFSQCLLISILVYCVSLLPLNAPFNIGTEEAVWSGFMILAGMNSVQAISTAISIKITRIIILLIEGLIGSTILFFTRKRRPVDIN